MIQMYSHYLSVLVVIFVLYSSKIYVTAVDLSVLAKSGYSV